MRDPVVDLVADLRGGLPGRCDFCKEALDPEDALPEEGGLWACRACWRKFEEEDRKAASAYRREREK